MWGAGDHTEHEAPRELGHNAFIESFFHSMKADAIRAYIRRYNRSRLHSGLGYRSPIDYEHIAA